MAKYKVKFIKTVSLGGETIYETGEVYEIDGATYELVKDECEIIEEIVSEKRKESETKKSK